MSDYEKLSRVRRDLEEIRSDLSQRIAKDGPGQSDLLILHERVSRAIKALSPQS
ncbi:MAG: hypothetical protein ACU0CC_07640 [Sagittula sp.]|jgi:N-acetylglutamate synthase/N-acetylornithine aminotransferase|uniref:hypothetical protein n=1 Tax=unclassified Sagittula TaxID=2624628 RepID=UPI0018E28BD6|nr:MULTISPECIES: hypothetical protein [unclassified Sagittula]WHZ37898.1 hypothetical protein QNI11_24640 [Sagittula sp. MA-2]